MSENNICTVTRCSFGLCNKIPTLYVKINNGGSELKKNFFLVFYHFAAAGRRRGTKIILK